MAIIRGWAAAEQAAPRRIAASSGRGRAAGTYRPGAARGSPRLRPGRNGDSSTLRRRICDRRADVEYGLRHRDTSMMLLRGMGWRLPPPYLVTPTGCEDDREDRRFKNFQGYFSA